MQSTALAYLVYSSTDFLAPGWAPHLTPWIQLPAPLAEGAFSLSLIALGVNVERWTKRSSEATHMQSELSEPHTLHRGGGVRSHMGPTRSADLTSM